MTAETRKDKPKRTPKLENCRQIFERVKKNAQSRSDVPDFTWGIKHLDYLTHGINRGKTTILAARTSEGKTTMAIQTAVKNADEGKIVGYFSLEDDKEQLVEKVFCHITGTNNQDLKKGRQEALDRMNDPTMLKVMENLSLLVLDNFGYTVDEIREVVVEMDPKPDLIFLDYVQMVEGQDARDDSRRAAISEFARQMQKFAIKEKIGVVIVSQINRKGAADGRPRMHHLAESGTLEQVADVVLLMYIPAKYDDHSYDFRCIKNGNKVITTSGMEVCPTEYLELEVAKNKTGPIGVATARFKKYCYQIEDWTNPTEEGEHEKNVAMMEAEDKRFL